MDKEAELLFCVIHNSWFWKWTIQTILFLCAEALG
jgi:hypothetical protein